MNLNIYPLSLSIPAKAGIHSKTANPFLDWRTHKLVSSLRWNGENSLSLMYQRGALFGLDARIALAIFGVISVVAGASMVLGLDSTRAKSLATELTDTGRAVEGFQADIQADIFASLLEPTEKNAYAALFDAKQVTEENNLRGRWLGPYVSFTSSQHPTYGEMLLRKRAGNAGAECTEAPDCYIWVVYGTVKNSIVTELNGIIDGPNEKDASTEGRLQWKANNDTTTLNYRAAKALSME